MELKYPSLEVLKDNAATLIESSLNEDDSQISYMNLHQIGERPVLCIIIKDAQAIPHGLALEHEIHKILKEYPNEEYMRK